MDIRVKRILFLCLLKSAKKQGGKGFLTSMELSQHIQYRLQLVDESVRETDILTEGGILLFGYV